MHESHGRSERHRAEGGVEGQHGVGKGRSDVGVPRFSSSYNFATPPALQLLMACMVTDHASAWHAMLRTWRDHITM